MNFFMCLEANIHSFKYCLLTSRLTHTAQKGEPPSPSQSECGLFPGSASLTYSFDSD